MMDYWNEGKNVWDISVQLCKLIKCKLSYLKIYYGTYWCVVTLKNKSAYWGAESSGPWGPG